jgi:hypothetical protein
VVLVGLLDQKSDTTLLAGDDADSLLPSCQFHYSTIVHTDPGFRCVCTVEVGRIWADIPCWRSGPHSASSQPIAPQF